jgi:hypothetical protein
LKQERASRAIDHPRSGPPITQIKEFPYPTEESDPPKGMVERPIMKRVLPDGTANQALDPASPSPPPTSSPVTRGRRFGSEAISRNAIDALIAEGTPLVYLVDRMTPALWEEIAGDYLWAATLDESSRRFMMAKMPLEILLPGEIKTGAAQNPETPFGKTLQRFADAIARDMMRNEYLNHLRIHQWLEQDTEGTLTSNVEALNKKVYEAIFLTPDYDAWLGLVPEDTYTALEKDGCACDKGAPPMRAPQVAR